MNIQNKEKEKPLEKQDWEVVKMLYERASNDWRHYDSHIWQIPSIALAINTFMISLAFNADFLQIPCSCVVPSLQNLLTDPYRMVRVFIILLAGCFTFVLLIALVKHRLHQRAKDKNLENFEKLFSYETEIFNTKDPVDLQKIEPNAIFIEKWLAGLKTNHFLMGVMTLAVIIDGFIMIGIALGGW